MGTSASSKGPGHGVPFDPPWLDDIAPPSSGDEASPEDPGSGNTNGAEPASPEQAPPLQVQLAPKRRFANARRAMGNYVRIGQGETFRKAVGHYSHTGMGGARNVARRMRVSTSTGANVISMLQSAREGTDPAITEWVSSLTQRNAGAQEIAGEIIRRAVPTGGSQDEAACQESMAQALQDLIEDNETVDLLHLSDDEIWTLVESFLGYEAFARLCLDIGQVFEDSALSARERVERMNEMQDYLKADLAAQIERLRSDRPNATSAQLQSILQNALENTFTVYEEAI